VTVTGFRGFRGFREFRFLDRPGIQAMSCVHHLQSFAAGE